VVSEREKDPTLGVKKFVKELAAKYGDASEDEFSVEIRNARTKEPRKAMAAAADPRSGTAKAITDEEHASATFREICGIAEPEGQRKKASLITLEKVEPTEVPAEEPEGGWLEGLPSITEMSLLADAQVPRSHPAVQGSADTAAQHRSAQPNSTLGLLPQAVALLPDTRQARGATERSGSRM